MSQIQRNIYNNGLFILFARILSLLASLIIVPVIIDKLGINGYGKWESILALTSIVTIITSAISQTLTWQVALSYGNKQLDGTRIWFRIAITIIIAQLLIVSPLLFFFSKDIADFFQIEVEINEGILVIIPLLGSIMILGSITDSIGSIVAGFQKSGKVILVQTISIIISQIIIVVSLYANLGYYSLLIGYSTSYLTSFIMLTFLSRRLIGRLPFKLYLITKKQLLTIRSFFLLTIIGSITLIFRNQITKLLISSLADSEMVGNFGIAARLSSLVYLISIFFMVPTQTAVSSLYAVNNWTEIRNVYLSTTRMFTFLSGLLICILCVLIERVSIIWVGFSNQAILFFSLILLIGQTIAVMTTAIGVAICIGIGKRQIETYYILINLTLNLLLLYPFIRLWGAYGAVIASSISWALSGIIFLIIFQFTLKLPIEPIKILFKNALIVGVLIIIFRFSIQIAFPLEQLRTNALKTFVQISIPLTISYFAANYLFNLIPPEFYKLLHNNKFKSD